jgi:hypothetical protein
VTATVSGAEVELEAFEQQGLADRVIALPESTVYVPAGWSARVDSGGAIRMTR